MDGLKPVRFAISRAALEALEEKQIATFADIENAFDRHAKTIYALAGELYGRTSAGENFVHRIEADMVIRFRRRGSGNP